MTEDPAVAWEQSVLDAVNAYLRRNYPGALSGRPLAPDRPWEDYFDEPARLVGSFPNTELTFSWCRLGKCYERVFPLWDCEYGVPGGMPRWDPEDVAVDIGQSIGD